MCHLPPNDPTVADERIARLIDEYFDRRQAGEDISVAQFACEHPDVAALLEPYLAGLKLIESARTRVDDAAAMSAAIDAGCELPEIDGYELEEELGRGGMGVVYRARQVATKRDVAIKVLLAGPFASGSARHRFQREVELAARLRHPNIVQVLESGRVGHQQYYAMEYVDGARLDRYLASLDETVQRATALSVFTQVCDAVEYAHQHGVVHRDLKPANVLIVDDGAGGTGGQGAREAERRQSPPTPRPPGPLDPHPKILDFGLAKTTDHSDTDADTTTCVSLAGQVVGTLAYLSPEQAAGLPGEIDPRTDVYSLGVMLYELVTGALPFPSQGRPSEVLRTIIEASPPPPSSVVGHVDSDLETIILKTLEKEKDRRYQSAGELADDVRRYLDGEPIRAHRPSGFYILRKKISKHRVAAVSAVAIFAVVTVAFLAAERQRRLDWQRARKSSLVNQRSLDSRLAQEVIGPAQAAYRECPDLPEARLVYAHAMYRTDQQDGAVRFLEREVSVGAAADACRALLAEMYESAGNEERARVLREELPPPESADDWYVRSFATLDRGRALECARMAVKLDPQHRLALERLTWLHLRTGDLDGALAGTERLIEITGDIDEWVTFKGHVLVRKGDYGGAVAQYTRVVENRPTSSSGYRYRALACRRLGDYEQAVVDYTTALRLDGEVMANAWDHYQRATPLWILGRVDEAIADYRRTRAMLARPFYSDARMYFILRELGRDVEAEQVLLDAVEDVREPWLRLIFRFLGGRVSADELVRDASERDDLEQLCEAYYYIGESRRLAGQTDEARDWFEKCKQTGVEFDVQSFPLTAMNEYELACWRLTQLAESENQP